MPDAAPRLLLRNVRPWGRAAVDVLIEEGRIARIAPDIEPPDPDTPRLDGRGELLLPGLVNAHAHIDKTLLGRPWHRNELPGRRIADFVAYERATHAELGISAAAQSARQVARSLELGVTRIRSHVDVDAGVGLRNFEGVLATRERFGDRFDLQIVAFPQGGMLTRSGSAELMEEAVRLGADAVGGLDPSTVDRDPVRHLDTVFAIADRHGVEVDVHLHEPGALGAFAVELIAERTAALGMAGRVTISHVFCLGMIDDAYLERLTELLLEQRIAIMSLGTGAGAFPPLARLAAAGVRLCTGTDGVRDTWGPYNRVDMLHRVEMLGYRSGFRRDDELELLLRIATHGGAEVMGVPDYGVEVGAPADLVVLPGEAPAQAVIDRPARTHVIKGGRRVGPGEA